MAICLICGAENPEGASQCRRCGALLREVPMALAVGTKLKGGAYTVGKVLGQGGFGITYLGGDTRLRRPVAIKEFFPTGCFRRGTVITFSVSLPASDFQAMKQRFLQEARTLARFRHPGIVQVYDVFEENGTVYIVMEYLRGKPLSKILEERGGPLEEAEAVRYILQVCDALEVVHGSGLLHRDIKPDNIMVGQDGRAVLIDFGAAREFAARTTHSVILTHGYAPIEQYAEKAPRGPFTDIYALSATLYCLLTGEIPVSAPDRRVGIELPEVRQLNPRVSPYVAQAVMVGMDMDYKRRPQSVRAFRDMLCAGRAVPPAPQVAAMPSQPAPTATPAPLVLDELLESILSRLHGLTEQARKEDMLIDNFYLSPLERERVQWYTCNLEQGRFYLITGTGDDRIIVDLDARVYAPNGKLLEEDTLKDNVPVLRFQAPQSGSYTIEVWAHEMTGEEGFYTLLTGHKITSSAERAMMNVWEGIFDRFIALTIYSVQAGFRCLHAELDTIGERFTRSLSMELEGGHEYAVVATGDEIHVADLDMVIELPDGRKLEDKESDNIPQMSFRLDQDGQTKITLIAGRMQKGHEKGYYALFIGRK